MAQNSYYDSVEYRTRQVTDENGVVRDVQYSETVSKICPSNICTVENAQYFIAFCRWIEMNEKEYKLYLHCIELRNLNGSTEPHCSWNEIGKYISSSGNIGSHNGIKHLKYFIYME